jgi:hypothetical protein
MEHWSSNDWSPWNGLPPTHRLAQIDRILRSPFETGRIIHSILLCLTLIKPLIIVRLRTHDRLGWLATTETPTVTVTTSTLMRCMWMDRDTTTAHRRTNSSDLFYHRSSSTFCPFIRLSDLSFDLLQLLFSF